MVEGARLESVYTATYQGFESLSLRHKFLDFLDAFQFVTVTANSAGPFEGSAPSTSARMTTRPGRPGIGSRSARISLEAGSVASLADAGSCRCFRRVHRIPKPSPAVQDS